MTAKCVDASTSQAMCTVCFKASRGQRAEGTRAAFRGSEDLGFFWIQKEPSSTVVKNTGFEVRHRTLACFLHILKQLSFLIVKMQGATALTSEFV